MNKNIRNIDQVSSTLSMEILEEIVRNCQRNEQRLHELERHTRHERKRAERLLRETYRTKQERDKQMSTYLDETPKPKQQPIEFFIPLDQDQSHRQDKLPSFEKIDNQTHRVRFNIPENDNNIQIERKKSTSTDDLARRCEHLLSRLHIENSDDSSQRISSSLQNDQSLTLQQALGLFRPEFIFHSRERVERINHLREEREYQPTLPISHSNPIIHRPVQSKPVTYQEMKHASKKKYEQLPEVNNRLQQSLMNEIRRRNCLRAKIFRIRLRQHVLLHDRTNIDESLKMIDT